jgi:hypothetical protein
MSKIFSIFFVVVLITFSFFGLFSNVNASASTSAPYIVNATNGLNIRDHSCNIVNTVKYGTVMHSITVNDKISCNIKGINYTMLRAYSQSEGYIAEKFLTPIIQNPNGFIGTNAKINTTAGLNLRDQNCRKITTIPSNTIVKTLGSEPLVCTVNGQFYYMQAIQYNGTVGMVANFYLRAL